MYGEICVHGTNFKSVDGFQCDTHNMYKCSDICSVVQNKVIVPSVIVTADQMMTNELQCYFYHRLIREILPAVTLI